MLKFIDRVSGFRLFAVVYCLLIVIGIVFFNMCTGCASTNPMPATYEEEYNPNWLPDKPAGPLDYFFEGMGEAAKVVTIISIL